MAIQLSELETMRDTLVRNRAKGVRSLEIGGEKVQFGSDYEMSRAIADLEARIARASGATRPRSVAVRTSKGL